MALLFSQNQELKAVQQTKKDELDRVVKARESLKENIKSFVSPRKLHGKDEKSLEYPELQQLLSAKIRQLDQEIEILRR